MTTFCSHNQDKVEALEVLNTLHQYDLPDPSIVMVMRYTNTPLLPQGTCRFLYLNVSDLPRGASSAQFPLDPLHLWKLLPYSKTEVLSPCEDWEAGYRSYPPFSRGSMETLQRFAPPLQPSVTINAFASSPSPPRRRHLDREKIGL